MHPAYSVIVFTTASGAGYGLLFWLALGELAGALPAGRWVSVIALTLALALITVGLLASTLHLGHPERAARALSQWRSSWLSREGVAALATYGPAGLLWLFWVFDLRSGPAIDILAALAAIGAAATVYCTGMIYASLRTIRQWYRKDVAIIYLLMSAATGALLFVICFSFAGRFPLWAAVALIGSLVALGILKRRYWIGIDADPGLYTAEMATGLGAWGRVRPLDPPHTKPNFVMREMGYSVARKHAEVLRRVVLAALVLVPLVATIVAMLWAASAPVVMTIAVLSATVGVWTERWLFFAEAEHVSQLYYGASRA